MSLALGGGGGELSEDVPLRRECAVCRMLKMSSTVRKPSVYSLSVEAVSSCEKRVCRCSSIDSAVQPSHPRTYMM